MYCPNCGAEINGKFCSNCGYQLNKTNADASNAKVQEGQLINGVEVDIAEIIKNNGKNKITAVKELILITGVGFSEGKQIIDKAYKEMKKAEPKKSFWQKAVEESRKQQLNDINEKRELKERIKQTKDKKKNNGLSLTITTIILIFILVSCLNGGKKEDVKEKEAQVIKKVQEEVKTPEELEEEKYREWVEGQFSPWDGSHRELVKLLKENLNDAKSFEHVETMYEEMENGDLTIIMKYRASNAFGGKVLSYVKAVACYEDNTITIIECE